MSLQLAEDTYNNTVLAMWEKLLPRLDLQQNSVDFLTSCSSVIDIITNYLWLRKSDLLRSTYTVNVYTGNNSFCLPDGFIAVETEPVITVTSTSQKVKLVNLPEEKRHTFTETGIPEFYELIGNQIYLYPSVSEDITCSVDLFVKPDTLTSFDSLLPFNGVFDSIIADSALRLSNVGMSLLSDQAFQTSIHVVVDRTINMRTKKTITFRMV